MKRILALTVILLLILLAFPLRILAQEAEKENAIEISGDSFDLEIRPLTQSIFNKSVPIKLTIKSNINTDRLEVRWQLPATISQKGDSSDIWGSITAGETAEVITTIVPTEPGAYTIVAEVQAWQADANYVDTISIDLSFDKHLEIQPQTEEYYRNQRYWFFAKIAIATVAIIVICVLGWFGVKKFNEWLDKD